MAYWAEFCHVGTCSTTMRTEIVRQSHGMRTDLFVTEDYEFWLYLSTFGKWGLIPDILYVSDGSDVTLSQGWLNKMKRRWQNAPSIAEWEKELFNDYLNNLSHIEKQEGVSPVISLIASYSLIDYY